MTILDSRRRDDSHINCVRFSENETIQHKLAKCLSGIMATERVSVEDIERFFSNEVFRKCFEDLYESLIMWCNDNRTDKSSFIQEALVEGGDRRIDHLQITKRDKQIGHLYKILEFETNHNIKKKDADVTVYI